MRFATERLGEIVFKKATNGLGQDSYEAQIEVSGKPVSVELMWQDDESTALQGALETVTKQLAGIFEAGQAALAADLANERSEYGVSMYCEHHSEVLGADELAAAVGNATPSKQDFMAHLRPYCLRVGSQSADGRYELDYELDYGIGLDVTNYLVCVRMDDELRVREVVVES